MVAVFQKTASGGHPFLFVQDDAGNPVGLVAAEDVLKRVTNPDPSEMVRWMDMPAETALQSRLEVPNVGGKPVTDESALKKVTKDGVLLGVITETDVLISWRSIQKTLKNSQGDAVTGLPNRATFDQHLEAESNRAQRCHHSVAVILVDLDKFKQINDTYGHSAGDSALSTVTNALRKSLRSYDMVARFGGDEFAVICSGCRPGEIDIVIRRLREEVLKLQHDPTVPKPVPTISVGASVVHDMKAGADIAEMIERADECLYAAKRVGRNCAFKVETVDGVSPDPEFVEDRYADVDRNRVLFVEAGV
jgi:diguanylate cyclase (GGDEF)-like protein